MGWGGRRIGTCNRLGMGSVTGSFERKERRGVGATVEEIGREAVSAGEEVMMVGARGSISGWWCNYVTQTLLTKRENELYQPVSE